MSNRFASKEDAEHMAGVLNMRYGRLFEAKIIPVGTFGQNIERWGVVNTAQQAFMWLDIKARFPLPMDQTDVRRTRPSTYNI